MFVLSLRRLTSLLSPGGIEKSLYLGERDPKVACRLFVSLGIRRWRAWKNLAGFKKFPWKLIERLSLENLSRLSFFVLLSQNKVQPRSDAEQTFVCLQRSYDQFFPNVDAFASRIPSFREFMERGLINPFASQICNAAARLEAESGCNCQLLDSLLRNQIAQLEQITRRAVILEMNISYINDADPEKDGSNYLSKFSKAFDDYDTCRNFFDKYPVLFRIVDEKLNSWVHVNIELLHRLSKDRAAIQDEFGLSIDAHLISASPSGDCHSGGRSVNVLEFDDGSRIIYKPRSVYLERAFQNYIKYFNSLKNSVELATIAVLDKGSYGWIEFVRFEPIEAREDAERFHTRLGYLIAVIYSINGVDVFFENLIARASDPIVIDCEAMFHTFIEREVRGSPVVAMSNALDRSVVGIGILPQPGVGASDTEVFDISVLGARVEARAPYTVTGVENFGHANMRIAEIPGWIPDNKAGSEADFATEEKGRWILAGLKKGFDALYENRAEISMDRGVIDQCFSGAMRRLIVRDTKVYGSLQQDETHPDLIRDQLDREWHWDNLWSELEERPILSLFIASELSQAKRGDIPYFSGPVGSTDVTGGDGTQISLAKYNAASPIDEAKRKVRELTADIVSQQLRLAATSLGLVSLSGITQPDLNQTAISQNNAIAIAEYLTDRITSYGSSIWLDSCFNPVPKANGLDPVRVVPVDPFLYEGAAGVAMFLCDVGMRAGRGDLVERSLGLSRSIMCEVDRNTEYPISGFCGLGSLVYMFNRCLCESTQFKAFQDHIERLLASINAKLATERQLDILLGISGTGLSILPYAIRSSSVQAKAIIEVIYLRLLAATEPLLRSPEPIEGMQNLRGFSHGISGVALALYRMGIFLNGENVNTHVSNLLLREAQLVRQGGWTDGHFFAGKPLVGWCHGSAGISLAMKEMPAIRRQVPELEQYFQEALQNTIQNGIFQSNCLCHGTTGNLQCIEGAIPNESEFVDRIKKVESDIFKKGFCSFGAAQTMGVGLMTGLAGLGYHFLQQEHPGTAFDFLSLK